MTLNTEYTASTPTHYLRAVIGNNYTWGPRPKQPQAAISKLQTGARINAVVRRNYTSSVLVFAFDTPNILPTNIEVVGIKIKLNSCVLPPMKHIGTNIFFHTWLSLNPFQPTIIPEISFFGSDNPGVVSFKPTKSNATTETILGEEDSISWQVDGDPFPLIREELLYCRFFVMASNKSGKANTFGFKGKPEIMFYYNELAGTPERVIDEFSVLAFRVDSDINENSAGLIDDILVRWNEPVRVQVHNAESEDTTNVTYTLGLLNQLTEPGMFTLSEDTPQIHVWFVPNDEFENYVDITGIDVNQVGGICDVIYNEDYEITSAVCVVSNDEGYKVGEDLVNPLGFDTLTSHRQQITRHELFHAIGMSHSTLEASAAYPDYVPNKTYYFSAIDRKVIEAIYDLDPGSTREECLDYLNNV
jgi:hypothetical protein